jgi:hypothetical protein
LAVGQVEVNWRWPSLLLSRVFVAMVGAVVVVIVVVVVAVEPVVVVVELMLG